MWGVSWNRSEISTYLPLLNPLRFPPPSRSQPCRSNPITFFCKYNRISDIPTFLRTHVRALHSMWRILKWVPRKKQVPINLLLALLLKTWTCRFKASFFSFFFLLFSCPWSFLFIFSCWVCDVFLIHDLGLGFVCRVMFLFSGWFIWLTIYLL